jgi:hypothetical protein
MNRRRRNLLIQLGLGLSVGVVVPLAVIAVLLATGDDDEGTTVRISPSAAPAQPARGLGVTRGKELERYLLTTGELGSGWTVLKQGTGSGLSLDKAVEVVPEVPNDCSAFPGVQATAFTTPWARTALFNNKARKSVFETIYVFRPGMAQETIAFLRGLVARCERYDQKIKIGSSTSTTHITMTASAGPRLGDESLRVETRYSYGGNIVGGSRNEALYVRVGDTVLLCSSSTGGLDALTGRALAKIT